MRTIALATNLMSTPILDPDPRNDLDPDPRNDLDPDPRNDLDPEPRNDFDPDPSNNLTLFLALILVLATTLTETDPYNGSG